MRIVIALGSSALVPSEEPLDPAQQVESMRRAARVVAGLAVHHSVVVTHGNAPVVGALAAAGGGTPLDVAGAESEGLIGYWLDQELLNLLPGLDVAALLTQVEVDPADPVFSKPAKPIGRVYDAEEAKRMTAERGWRMRPANGGMRRVVASPEPLHIVEQRTLELLVRLGVLVVCGGGGGIPVARDAQGRLHGVEAVIDKDASAARLAIDLDADFLLLLSDVRAVYADWPERHRPIRAMPPRHVHDFEFEPGTMRPKIEAAYRFARHPGATAAIGALEDAACILRGEAGTCITADASSVQFWGEATAASPAR